MGKKRVLVGYGVDVDAVAGWLGSYGGEDSTNDISRGMYAEDNLREETDKTVSDTSSTQDFLPAQLEPEEFSSYLTNTTSKAHGSSPVIR